MSSSGASTRLSFTIATRSKASPNVRVQAPVPQKGTLGPVIKTFENVEITNLGRSGGYALWTGSVDLGVKTAGALSVSVLNGKGNIVDMGFF